MEFLNKYTRGDYDAIVYIDGSEVVAEDNLGRRIASGVAGTDDLTVIHAARDAINDYDVLRLTGDFVITNYITLNKPIYIDGRGASISTSASISYMMYISADDVTVDGLELTTSTAGVRNIWIYGTSTPKIINCRLTSADTAIETTQDGSSNWTDGLIANNNIINALGVYLHYTKNSWVGNNVINHPSTAPYISLEFYDYCEKCTFFGNVLNYTARDSDSFAIEVGHSTTHTATCHNNNVLYNIINGAYIGIDINVGTTGTLCQGNEIHVDDADGYAGIQNRGGTADFIDNEIHAHTYGMILKGDVGYATKHNNVVGGYIEAPTGIYIYNQSPTACISGVRLSTTTYGISVGSAGVVSIKNLKCVGTGGACIYIGYGSTYPTHVILDGNDMSGAGYANKILIYDAPSQSYYIRRNYGYVTENSGSSAGTGAEQTIAHGLVSAPSKVDVVPTVTGALVLSKWADATNIYVTVTNGKTYNWSAEV